jgi:hypothetical protein
MVLRALNEPLGPALGHACALASALRRWASPPGPKPFEPSPLAVPAPCDDCWHAERCGKRAPRLRSVCAVHGGARPSRWLLRKRTPDARLYRALLGDDG